VSQGDSIQAAIFAARSGDTIIVDGGKYHEHLRVDKALTIKGLGSPVLDATASGSAITIKADGVMVTGLRIMNAGSWPEESVEEGAVKILSSHNTIVGNILSNNFNGVLIHAGEDNKVQNNSIDGNLGYGIHIAGSSNNKIAGNCLKENRQNAFDSGRSFWDGNYYSDFDIPGEGCTDGGQGICASGYSIAGGENTDQHPRTRP